MSRNLTGSSPFGVQLKSSKRAPIKNTQQKPAIERHHLKSAERNASEKVRNLKTANDSGTNGVSVTSGSYNIHKICVFNILFILNFNMLFVCLYYFSLKLFVTFSGYSSQGSQGRTTLLSLEQKNSSILFCFHFLHLLKKISLFVYC